jgi:hypothetical protein
LFADNIVPHVLSMMSLQSLDEMLSGTIPTSQLHEEPHFGDADVAIVAQHEHPELASLEDLVLAKPLSMRHKIVWTDRVEEEVDDNDDGDP